MYERSQVIELVVKMITKQQSKSQVKTRTIFFLFCAACSVLFDSLQSHRPQPTKLLCLWYFPGRNTEVGCQFLLQGICLTQGLNPRLLHQQGDSLPLHYLARTQFSSVQSLSCVQLFVTPWTAALQAALSMTNYRNLLKLMSITSVMPSNHLILCCPHLLLPSIFPSIRVLQTFN